MWYERSAATNATLFQTQTNLTQTWTKNVELEAENFDLKNQPKPTPEVRTEYIEKLVYPEQAPPLQLDGNITIPVDAYNWLKQGDNLQAINRLLHELYPDQFPLLNQTTTDIPPTTELPIVPRGKVEFIKKENVKDETTRTYERKAGPYYPLGGYVREDPLGGYVPQYVPVFEGAEFVEYIPLPRGSPKPTAADVMAEYSTIARNIGRFARNILEGIGVGVPNILHNLKEFLFDPGEYKDFHEEVNFIPVRLNTSKYFGDISPFRTVYIAQNCPLVDTAPFYSLEKLKKWCGENVTYIERQEEKSKFFIAMEQLVKSTANAGIFISEVVTGHAGADILYNAWEVVSTATSNLVYNAGEAWRVYQYKDATKLALGIVGVAVGGYSLWEYWLANKFLIIYRTYKYGAPFVKLVEALMLEAGVHPNQYVNAYYQNIIWGLFKKAFFHLSQMPHNQQRIRYAAMTALLASRAVRNGVLSPVYQHIYEASENNWNWFDAEDPDAKVDAANRDKAAAEQRAADAEQAVADTQGANTALSAQNAVLRQKNAVQKGRLVTKDRTILTQAQALGDVPTTITQQQTKITVLNRYVGVLQRDNDRLRSERGGERVVPARGRRGSSGNIRINPLVAQPVVVAPVPPPLEQVYVFSDEVNNILHRYGEQPNDINGLLQVVETIDSHLTVANEVLVHATPVPRLAPQPVVFAPTINAILAIYGKRPDNVDDLADCLEILYNELDLIKGGIKSLQTRTGIKGLGHIGYAVETLRGDIRMLQSRITGLQADVATLTHQRDDALKGKARAENLFNSERETTTDLKRTNGGLQVSLKDLVQEGVEKDKTIRELREQKQAAEEGEATANARNTDLQGTIDKQDVAIRRLRENNVELDKLLARWGILNLEGLAGRLQASADFRRDVEALRTDMGMDGVEFKKWLGKSRELHALDVKLLTLAQRYGCKDTSELLVKYEEAMKFKADVEKLFADTGTHDVGELSAYVGRQKDEITRLTNAAPAQPVVVAPAALPEGEAYPIEDVIVDPLVEGEINELAIESLGGVADIPPVVFSDEVNTILQRYGKQSNDINGLLQVVEIIDAQLAVVHAAPAPQAAAQPVLFSPKVNDILTFYGRRPNNVDDLLECLEGLDNVLTITHSEIKSLQTRTGIKGLVRIGDAFVKQAEDIRDLRNTVINVAAENARLRGKRNDAQKAEAQPVQRPVLAIEKQGEVFDHPPAQAKAQPVQRPVLAIEKQGEVFDHPPAQAKAQPVVVAPAPPAQSVQNTVLRQFRESVLGATRCKTIDAALAKIKADADIATRLTIALQAAHVDSLEELLEEFKLARVSEPGIRELVVERGQVIKDLFTLLVIPCIHKIDNAYRVGESIPTYETMGLTFKSMRLSERTGILLVRTMLQLGFEVDPDYIDADYNTPIAADRRRYIEFRLKSTGDPGRVKMITQLTGAPA